MQETRLKRSQLSLAGEDNRYAIKKGRKDLAHKTNRLPGGELVRLPVPLQSFSNVCLLQAG